ncbi:hypothetical protein BRADI_4g07252v3 [Brachypodium distachyon]|uniref:Reverse transcriptase zinc-binding domain-containing protein n=1 Tax=Brachypodium distachyon TaxID=15368 RepID=A0A2K2CKZ6_BRADI|nr:hypothetical protein BRADI_4g07252v3 [Brachypodium distachyon]
MEGSPSIFLVVVTDAFNSLFLAGRTDAQQGHCVVAWAKVCLLIRLGGLGVRDANLLRWPWLQRSEVEKPWASFRIRFSSRILALFREACYSVVGNGRFTLFWSDNWIDGKSVESLAPVVFAAVGRRITRTCSVADALARSAWIRDISGPLNAQGMVEFLQLVGTLEAVVLIPGQEDVLRWR